MLILLDHIRATYLCQTMKYPLLRRWYLDRPRRLGVNFLLVSITALLFSLALPLWVLAIGPVVYGLPHLVASLRYSAFSIKSRHDSRAFLKAVTLITVLVALVRLWQILGWPPAIGRWSALPQGNGLEVLGMSLVLLAGIFFLRARCWRPILWACLATALLLHFSLRFPLVLAGLMILAHNFIGFFYWIGGSQKKADRTVAVLALILFAFIHWALFSGRLDGLNSFFSPSLEIPGGLNGWEIGSSLFPNAGIDVSLWIKGVTAYAFGQSIHYFVWLRAIPEVQLTHPTPSSFRQSRFYLERDLGTKGAQVAVLTVLALSLFWLLLKYNTARHCYLAAACFHGYAELLGLAFLFGSPSQEEARRDR